MVKYPQYKVKYPQYKVLNSEERMGHMNNV